MTQEVSLIMTQEVSLIMTQEVNLIMIQEVSLIMTQEVSLIMTQEVSLIMKRKFKQWWLPIPQISIKRTTTFNLKPFSKKKKEKKDHTILLWKSRTWFGTSTKMW